MAKSSKRRGMNPILSFILGILVGLILLIGAVGITVFVLINYSLDNIEANKDGDGNYIFINADPDNGGAGTVLDLFMKLTELSGDEELTLGKVEDLLPITSVFTDGIYSAFSSFADVDKEALRDTLVAELNSFLQNAMLDSRMSSILQKFGGEDMDENTLLGIIVNGKEADYVKNGDDKYPVYYYVYEYNEAEGKYEHAGNTLNPDHERFLVEKDGEYRLYVYNYDNKYYVTERGEDGAYIFVEPVRENVDQWNDGTLVLTGNYYYGENGEKVEVTPVTLRSLIDGSVNEILNEVYVSSFLDGDDELSQKLIGNVTIGDLVDGNVDFEEILDGLEIPEFVDIDPKNSVMVYLGYGITGVLSDGHDNFTGVHKLEDGTTVKCYLDTEPWEDGLKVTQAYYYDESGNRVIIAGTKVSEMHSRLKVLSNELALSDLINVYAPGDNGNNSIMIFLAYSVTDVQPVEGEDYSFVGNYHNADGEVKQCYIITADGIITDIYVIDVDGERKTIDKTSISQTPSQIEKLTDTLKIGEFIEIDDGNKFLKAISDSTLNELPERVNNLALNELYADSIYNKDAQEQNPAPAQWYLAVSGEAGEGEIQFNPAYLYYVKDGDNYTLVNYGKENAGKLTAEQFKEGTYYTRGEANALWKILLYVDGSEVAYSVNNLNSMINNVSKNTKNTTMRELHEAGILVFENESELDYFVDSTHTKTVGEMTLGDLVNAFISMIGGIQG